MESLKNNINTSSSPFFINFEAIAEQVVASISSRIGMAAGCGDKNASCFSFPLLKDSLGLKLLLPACKVATSRLSSKISTWGKAEATDASFSFTPLMPLNTHLIENLLTEVISLSMTAFVSEACAHALAAADRQRSDEAEERLLMALCWLS